MATNLSTTKIDQARNTTLPRSLTDEAAQAAIRRIAPLWPLKHFVAVNPFVGLTDMPFASAAQRMADTFGARLTPTRAQFADLLNQGHITLPDIEAALAGTQPPAGLPDHPADAARAIADRLASGATHDLPARLPTVANLVAIHRGIDWPRIFTDHIGAFAARHFDEGEAAWAGPVRSLGFWPAFQFEARHDRSLELLGLSGVRPAIAALPANALDAINVCANRLGLKPEGLEIWFHRTLADIAGWAGHARYRLWQAELQGRTDHSLIDLLAARLACETALLQILPPTGMAMAAWVDALRRINAPQPMDSELEIDALLQRAREMAFARSLAAQLRAPRPAAPAVPAAVQAVFCIDVRSEPFRRQLEALSPAIQTIGFAGFFGLPLDYVPLGQREGQARLPVLLSPALQVPEHVHGACAHETGTILEAARVRRRSDAALSAFKRAAVASFAYVETLGPVHALKLISDSLGLTRPAPEPFTAGHDADTAARLGPDISGLDTETMVDAAEAMLRGMSLTSGFAPILLLLGHGSTSVNNPHASGLDCGACGGHDGAPNARIAAMMLNRPDVRAGLATRGITIPAESWAIAGLHDTTTDHVRLYDEELVPDALRSELMRLTGWLDIAGGRTRIERAPKLALASPRSPHAEIEARAKDWSQVRPEWGLANCAAFIAAPRHRTAHLDLEGRSFLHSYDHKADAARGYPVLELIMTAPMIVASWISLQYYGSALDNQHFGAGNKLLHNAIGSIGVLEGQGGDLRGGLPFQSVHDGERLAHEPLRLMVCIEAPQVAIDAVIAKHQMVAHLLAHHWLGLMAIAPDGQTRRWIAPGQWA